MLDSFGTAKRSMHVRYDIEEEKNYEWHHVVGQFNAKRSAFSGHDLHCTDNLIYLPKSVHDLISSHYRRVPDPPRAGFRHVYDWQATFSFAEQWSYGIAVLQQHKMTIPDRMQP